MSAEAIRAPLGGAESARRLVGGLLLGILVAVGIDRLSFVAADLVLPAVAGLDPDGVFARITIHHVVQAGLALGLMWVAVSRWPGATWTGFGFTTREWRRSLRAVGLFALVWVVVQVGVGLAIMAGGGGTADPGYPLVARNIAGVLAFQALLSGTSEEILFRGLVMTGLAALWRPVFDDERALGWAATIGATIVFVAGHVGFTLAPPAITHVNLLQLGTAAVFGVFYGRLFWATRSLVGPIVAHGLLNVIITLSLYGLFAVFGR